MHLQPRDLKLLASLARYGILSSHQIGELHFKNIRHTTMMRRLRMHEEKGYILRSKGLPDQTSTWYLSNLGAKEVGAHAPPRYTNQNVILHEVTVSEVRLSLEAIGLGHDFTTEREMRRQYDWKRDRGELSERVIPDGLFMAQKGGKSHVVALEVELQTKNHERLKKVFKHYASMSSVGWVLYAVGNVSIGNLVLREWKKVPRYSYSPNLFAVQIDDLKVNGTNATAYDYLGIKNPLHLVFDCKKSLLSPDDEGGPETAQSLSGPDANGLSKEAA